MKGARAVERAGMGVTHTLWTVHSCSWGIPARTRQLPSSLCQRVTLAPGATMVSAEEIKLGCEWAALGRRGSAPLRVRTPQCHCQLCSCSSHWCHARSMSLTRPCARETPVSACSILEMWRVTGRLMNWGKKHLFASLEGSTHECGFVFAIKKNK